MRAWFAILLSGSEASQKSLAESPWSRSGAFWPAP